MTCSEFHFQPESEGNGERRVSNRDIRKKEQSSRKVDRRPAEPAASSVIVRPNLSHAIDRRLLSLDQPHRFIERRRAAEKIALRLRDPDTAQCAQFGGSLDALSNDPTTGIARERDERRGQRLAHRIEIDVSRERNVKFDQIRMDLQDVLQASIARRQDASPAAERTERTHQTIVVTDVRMFSYLKNNAIGRPVPHQRGKIAAEDGLR
jgi:hypothetical protein